MSEVVDMALSNARMLKVIEWVIAKLNKDQDPLKKICSSSCYFNPLVRLYDWLRENKDIVPLSDLPKEKKQEYWEIVYRERPEKSKYIRVMICQAIHAYKTVIK